jgi:hypothetical protein
MGFNSGFKGLIRTLNKKHNLVLSVQVEEKAREHYMLWLQTQNPYHKNPAILPLSC